MTESQDLDATRLLALVSVLALAWNIIGNLWHPGLWYVPANLLAASLLLVLAVRSGFDLARLGLARERVRSGLAWGAAAAALVAVVVAVAVAIPAVRRFFEDERLLDHSPVERWFFPLVRIPLGTVVFEEVLFRSVLLAVLLTRTKRSVAVGVSAAAYGLWHIGPALRGAEGSGAAVTGEVLGTVLVTTTAGVVFAGLRLVSGSLLASILAHTATNSFSYVGAVAALAARSEHYPEDFVRTTTRRSSAGYDATWRWNGLGRVGSSGCRQP